MDEEKYIVKLEGHVLTLDDCDQVPHQEFLEEFTRWLESKGYGWFGFSVQTDIDGKVIEDRK